MKIYKELLKKYGRQNWWPAGRAFSDPRFEIAIGAILTQNAAWANAEKALDCLVKAEIRSPHAILRTHPRRLALCLRSSGYYNQKAKALRALCRILNDCYKGKFDIFFSLPAKIIREKLLEVCGIGPETADSIILYAARKPIFVVDTYTKRFVKAHALSRATSYNDLQNFFQNNLPRSVPLYQEFHALIVRWGKDNKMFRT